MKDYFHCELCDKSLTDSTTCKYTIENPSFLHIENILQNYVDD